MWYSMQELSKILTPWLAEHGYHPTHGGGGSDFLDQGKTTLGWISDDFIEVGTKITLTSGIGSWYGSPYVKLQASEPDFLHKLLMALERASKVGQEFDRTHKQVEGLYVPKGHPESHPSLDPLGCPRS